MKYFDELTEYRFTMWRWKCLTLEKESSLIADQPRENVGIDG